MNNKILRAGPLALTNAAANILNPAAATGGVNAGSSGQYIIVRTVSVVNKTSASHNFSLYVGLTGGSAAGTEAFGTGLVVAANSTWEWRGMIRLDTADFLTGLADANTSLTITIGGEVGVSG